VIGLFDWGRKEKDKDSHEIDLPLDRIGLPAAPAYAAFDFWADRFLPPISGRLKATLPERSCQILAVRPLQAYPQVLSTSRHVTQGMIDVTAETWNAERRELSGRSRVVGGDAYELRIHAGGPDASWTVAGADVSAADRAAGVAIGVKASEGGVRVTIQSTAGREVAWSVRFEKAGKSK